MTTRRGFLGAILAAGVAPAVVGSSILMPVRKIVAPLSHEEWSRSLKAAPAIELDAARPMTITSRTLCDVRLGDVLSIAGVSMHGRPAQFRVTSVVGGLLQIEPALA